MARKKTVHLSTKNENALEKFRTYIRATRSKNEGTLKSYYYSVQRVLHIVNKDYNKITSEDLDKAFSQIGGASCELIKTKFKIFLRWKKMDKLADSIKVNYSEFKKLTKSHKDILSPEEIKKFINTPLRLRDKALIELYIASGGRRKEISSLLIGDIEITETVVRLHLDGKTGNRPVSIVANSQIASAINPKNFLIFYQNHPFKDDPTKPLFFSLSKSNRGSALNEGSINGIIERIYRESGIEKKITPHILRHTSATYDGSYLSEPDMRLKYGWKLGSKMVQRYCHANYQHLEDHLLKIAGLTDEKVREQTICPRCEEINNINAERCSRCNFILDRKLLMEKVEQDAKRNEATDKEIKDSKREIKDLHKENEEIKKRLNVVDELVTLLKDEEVSLGNLKPLSEEAGQYEKELEQNATNKAMKRLQKLMLEDPEKYKDKKIVIVDGMPLLLSKNEIKKSKEEEELFIEFQEKLKRLRRKHGVIIPEGIAKFEGA